MSKYKSSETLAKIAHGEDINSLELEDRIELLTTMLSHPTKSKRDTYIAAKICDKKGNINAEHWEYQLTGAASITSVPIAIIFGTALYASLIGGVQFNNAFVPAVGATFLAEIAAIAGTNAYMTTKGSKMSKTIRANLTSNLETLGYQITPNNEPLISSADIYYSNNKRLLDGQVTSTKNNRYIHLIEEDEFITKVASFIKEIIENPYNGFAEDINELKEIAVEWIALNYQEYKRTGQKLGKSFIPIDFYTKKESEIRSKMDKTLKKVSK